MKKKPVFFIVFLKILFFSQVFAAVALADTHNQPDTDSWIFDAISPRFDFSVKGIYYGDDSMLEPQDVFVSSMMTVYLSRELTPETMLYVNPRINLDRYFVNDVQLLVENNEDRPFFTLNEAYIAWYGDSIECEVGKKIYSWKVADGFSPLDNLNPIDILDPLNPEKIGIPSVSFLKMFESYDFQIVLLPFFVPDRQPDFNNRWLADDPEAKAAFNALYGMDPVLVDAGRDLPDNHFDKISLAARISSSTLVPGWDLAAVYRYGHNTLGVIRSDIDPLSLPLVYLTSEYPSYHMIGLSFSTTWGDVEFHGEVVYHDSRDNNKDEDYLAYITGINYTNYEWLDDWFDEIRMTVEYAGETITEKRDKTSVYRDKGASRGLTDNILGSVEFIINSDHSLQCSYIYNLDDNDTAFDLKMTSQLNDSTKIIYGYQNLSGGEDTFFGQWDDNDRLYFEILIQY